MVAEYLKILNDDGVDIADVLVFKRQNPLEKKLEELKPVFLDEVVDKFSQPNTVVHRYNNFIVQIPRYAEKK